MSTYAIIDRNSVHGVDSNKVIFISANKEKAIKKYSEYLKRKFIPLDWYKDKVEIFEKRKDLGYGDYYSNSEDFEDRTPKDII